MASSSISAMSVWRSRLRFSARSSSVTSHVGGASSYACSCVATSGKFISLRGHRRRHAVASYAQAATWALSNVAKLAEGSLRIVEHDRLVSWEFVFEDIDPQELVNQEEKAVRTIVEKTRESTPWGPEQELALLRFEEWKGEHVTLEDGEALVNEIDRQDGWTGKRATFHAELVDLKSDSRVGYVPLKLAMHMEDGDWAANDKDKEKKRDEANAVVGSEDVDPKLMKEVVDDVDDDSDDEMRQFDTKTLWTDTKKFYAKCRGFAGGAKSCKWSGFNTSMKSDHINNNLAASFNNKVKDLKDLPMQDMVDQLRITIM
ncbi:hypothetical protein D1007_42757 [Hordeum vulgare]|nr:hypothetical protein D1007_42757 [Hordeum vulgare]